MPAWIYVSVAVSVLAASVVFAFAVLVRYRRRPLTRAARRHDQNPLRGSYGVLLACAAGVVLYLTATDQHTVGMLRQDHPSVVIEDIHPRGVMGLPPDWRQMHHGPSASPSSRRWPDGP